MKTSVDSICVAPSPPTKPGSESVSQNSETSQTAADFIREHEQMEADAREALPYSIDNCTQPLGPLRQSVFACLTCNPAPVLSTDSYNCAGICYACSVSCHGEHTLVEIFIKRNFTCDCGTTRLPTKSPCSLRFNPATNMKGGVHSEEASPDNKYNQNFGNRFCGCECDYDPFQQKGTMYQCLGLGTPGKEGCGEDWWHPGCLVGLGPDWFEKIPKRNKKTAVNRATSGSALAPILENEADNTADALQEEDDDLPNPPGFPSDDDFDGFLCYKCVEAFSWIKRYAGTPGFLPPVLHKDKEPISDSPVAAEPATTSEQEASKKRKFLEEHTTVTQKEAKRQKSNEQDLPVSQPLSSQNPETKTDEDTDLKDVENSSETVSSCKLPASAPVPAGRFSLFFEQGFRDHFCRCLSCFPLLAAHPQLLEEEDTYEPPLSQDGIGSENGGGSTAGSGSLLERGESALRNVDRVRAIEGVMAYNHLKDKLKPFFQQYAESGRAIGAEDIKAYFAKLRGDENAIQQAGEGAKKADGRSEQEGY